MSASETESSFRASSKLQERQLRGNIVKKKVKTKAAMTENRLLVSISHPPGKPKFGSFSHGIRHRNPFLEHWKKLNDKKNISPPFPNSLPLNCF